MAFIKKLSSALSKFGVWTGLLYIIDQCLVRINSRFRVYPYDLMVQSVHDDNILPSNLSNKIVVREIEKNDPILNEIPPPTDVVANRYDQGAVCLGAFRKAELVGYLWICFDSYEEDEIRCTFVPLPAGKSVFDFDFYIFPEHRFSIAFAALWDGTNDYLRQRGIRYTTSRVSRFNLQSISAHSHFDCWRVGRTLAFTGKQFQCLFATVPPYIDVSFSEASRPKIFIDSELP